MADSLAIINARIVHAEGVVEGDVRIADGRIAALGQGLSTAGCTRVIDAHGRHLLPGLIDDQVHFRQPGLTHKADIAHESRAAVAGGVTSFMEMPNTNPTTTDLAALAAKEAIASRDAVANYAFFFGASNANLEAVQRLEANRTCGVKIFMGSSTGDMLVDQPQVLDRIFRDCRLPIATHCEDTPLIKANEASARARWGDAVPMTEHPRIRSREACIASTRLAIELARRHGTNLHVLHISTAEELALFQAGPVAGKRITCEACVHHLWFHAGDYVRLGEQIKCNPAIKDLSDREAIRRAVRDDVIDVLATDHAPHLWEEKQQGYFQAPSGLPLVQFLLPALLDLVRQGAFPLTTLVRKTSQAVAERFAIRDRGRIAIGMWADLVLADLDAVTTVRSADVLSKCGWSPFAGESLRGRVDATLVNGVVVYEDGKITAGERRGRRLEYQR